MPASFSTSLFDFLTDLASNNDRSWFQEHKARYVEEVQEPSLAFINAFAPELDAISPHFQADSRVVGGSLFRIHRDTRFSKDKTPYKTNTGMHFRHDAGKDAHAPGFYLHLAPGECFAGAGLWRPEPKVAALVRQHIVEHPEDWATATQVTSSPSSWNAMGASLVRPPRGVDPEHPLLEDVKRKDFVIGQTIDEAQVTAEGFVDDFADMCRQVAPYMRFLCRAVDVPF